MHEEIMTAIDLIKKGDFNCIPLSARRGVTFSDEDVETVKNAGLQIVWADTFKGGCWHISE